MIENLHRRAMALAEQADAAASDRILLRQAYELEAEAAQLAVEQGIGQPSESVLLRSAASLAYECELYSEARKLIEQALAGSAVPGDIAAELLELQQDLNGRTQGAS